MSVHDIQLHSQSYNNFCLYVSGYSNGQVVAVAVLCVVVIVVINIIVLVVLKQRGYITLNCKRGKFR